VPVASVVVLGRSIPPRSRRRWRWLDFERSKFPILADVPEGYTIAAAAARCGLPETTLRYWEDIGLVAPVPRDPSSGHRRYRTADVELLETLANLRAVGLSIDDMRAYLAGAADAPGQRRALFEAHARRLAGEVAALRLRLQYLELKVRYWTARDAGDEQAADEVAAELGAVIRQINPREAES